MLSRITIRTEGDVSRAVVEGLRLAKAIGFPDIDANKVSTAVSELARNIIKYARWGEIAISSRTSARTSSRA